MKSMDDANSGSGNAGKTVSEEVYNQLFSKYGEQSNEVGTLRGRNAELEAVFEQFKPILEKFDEAPEIVEAIRSGKLNADTAKAILEGKATVAEAVAVDKATEAVKKEMGADAFQKADPAEIAKAVAEILKPQLDSTIEQKFGNVKTELDSLKEKDEEDRLQKFLASHPEIREDDELNEALYEAIEGDKSNTPFEDIYFSTVGKLAVKRGYAKNAQEAAETAKNASPGAGGSKTGGTADTDPYDALFARPAGKMYG